MKRLLFATVAVSMLCLTGCAEITALHNVSTSVPDTPQQSADTLSGALQLASTATRAVDVAVNVHKFSPENLRKISDLNDTVHDALGTLEKANAKGESLKFAAFNEALRKFNEAYAKAK